MKSEKLKEKIKIAEEAVEDIVDPELKKKAFEVILNKLVTPSSEGATIAQETKQEPAKEKSNSFEEPATDKFDSAKLAEAIGLSIDKLGSIIDFDGNDFHIVAQIPGGSHSEKQRNAALILLTINYYCTNEREYDAGKLRKRLEDLGIKSLVNMATILQNFETYFIKKGKHGSHSTVYRITNPGLQEGVKLLKELRDESENKD